MNMKPKFFLLDVDGVITSGQFLYSKRGKIYKVFGPDDQIDAYIALKFEEIHKFEHAPHPVEFEMYYSS